MNEKKKTEVYLGLYMLRTKDFEKTSCDDDWDRKSSYLAVGGWPVQSWPGGVGVSLIKTPKPKLLLVDATSSGCENGNEWEMAETYALSVVVKQGPI